MDILNFIIKLSMRLVEWSFKLLVHALGTLIQALRSHAPARAPIPLSSNQRHGAKKRHRKFARRRRYGAKHHAAGR